VPIDALFRERAPRIRVLARRGSNLPIALRTKDGAASLSDLVRSALRLRPDRIPVGEVRGAEALDLLKAWGTGHPGGVGTLHAGSAAPFAGSSNSSRKRLSPFHAPLSPKPSI